MIGYSNTSRDTYAEASIFDYFPHHQLEVLDCRRAWLTLHVPKAGRLAHPDNQREVKEIRRRYPNIIPSSRTSAAATPSRTRRRPCRRWPMIAGLVFRYFRRR